MKQCFICNKTVQKQHMIFEARNGNRKYIGKDCSLKGEKEVMDAIKRAEKLSAEKKLATVSLSELETSCHDCKITFNKINSFNGDLCFDCHEAKYPHCLLIGTNEHEGSYKDHLENMSVTD